MGPAAIEGERAMTVDRRTFVKSALGASGRYSWEDWPAPKPEPPGRATPQRRLGRRTRTTQTKESGIEHVIVVMMENRSFDHLLGWLPHANGKQAGLTYPSPQGTPTKTYHQTQFNGCDFTDPDHSYGGGRLQYNAGRWTVL